jgi:hypothetical protein
MKQEQYKGPINIRRHTRNLCTSVYDCVGTAGWSDGRVFNDAVETVAVILRRMIRENYMVFL